MYKAIHAQTGEEMIILNPFWLKKLDHLREMDRADLLVCQGCQQPLRVKAGEVKRPHFAHKHLQACSYGSESPEILNARAVLYGWLLKQFGKNTVGGVNQVVTLEKQVEELGLPRQVDCWVESGGRVFAYWLVEAGIKLEPREAIHSAFDRPGIHIHYVFLQAMLNEKKQEMHSLLLTPTERAFLRATEYDRLLSGAAEPGKSLHYLDADQAVLTTFRNLALLHAPNWYKGVKKTGHLSTIRADCTDGEFVQRGESEQVKAFRQKAQRLEAKRQKYHQREAAWKNRLAERKPRLENEPDANRVREMKTEQRDRDSLPCVICGQITSDYWATFIDDTGRRLCRCRECLDREIRGG
jgi:hypothetical protein